MVVRLKKTDGRLPGTAMTVGAALVASSILFAVHPVISHAAIDATNDTIPEIGAGEMESSITALDEEAAGEEILKGMEEEERSQLFGELYGGTDSDNSESDGGTTSDADGLRFDQMTDEEAAEEILKMLPDEETISAYTEETGNRVMSQASFRSGYDSKRGLYRYTLTDGERFYLSVPLGGWSDHAVALLTEDGARITSLTLNGEEVTNEPGTDGAWLFREAGRYSFLASGGRSGEYVVGSFRIVSVNLPVSDDFLWSPEGYRLASATADGAALPIADGRWLALDEDGRYDLTYTVTSGGTGLPEEYSLLFVRDTTPPVIEWEGELRDGRFVGEVHYTVDDPEAEVAIYYNGQPAYAEAQTLAAAGSYFVTATDKSGNMRVWQFVVMNRDGIPWRLVAAIFGVTAAVGVLLVLTARWGMRIR